MRQSSELSESLCQSDALSEPISGTPLTPLIMMRETTLIDSWSNEESLVDPHIAKTQGQSINSHDCVEDPEIRGTTAWSSAYHENIPRCLHFCQHHLLPIPSYDHGRIARETTEGSFSRSIVAYNSDLQNLRRYLIDLLGDSPHKWGLADPSFRQVTGCIFGFSLLLSGLMGVLVWAISRLYFLCLRNITSCAHKAEHYACDPHGQIWIGNLDNDMVHYKAWWYKWVLWFGVRAVWTHLCGSGVLYVTIWVLLPSSNQKLFQRYLVSVGCFVAVASSFSLLCVYLFPANENQRFIWGLNGSVWVALYSVWLVSRACPTDPAYENLTYAVLGTWFTTLGTNYLFGWVMIPFYAKHSQEPGFLGFTFLFSNLLVPLVSLVPPTVASILGRKLPPSSAISATMLSATPIITLALLNKFMVMNLTLSNNGITNVLLYTALISIQELIQLIFLMRFEYVAYYYLLIGHKEKSLMSRQMARNIHRVLQRGFLIILDIFFDITGTVVGVTAIFSFNITLDDKYRPKVSRLLIVTAFTIFTKFFIWMITSKVYTSRNEPITHSWVMRFDLALIILLIISFFQTSFVFLNTMYMFCPDVKGDEILFTFCS